jgi:hypothetical protein
VARPGIDAERFRPDLVPPVSRAELGLGEDDFVLVYHGTIHFANQHEMMSLYLGVKLLQRRGHKVRLVRLGHTEFGGPDPASSRALGDGVVELGPVVWRDIPAYLGLADAYVQPGPPDVFNRYRLPSKLPEFLAMGRPVILPHCNIGDDLTHESKSCSPTASWPPSSGAIRVSSRSATSTGPPTPRAWASSSARRWRARSRRHELRSGGAEGAGAGGRVAADPQAGR